MKRLSFEAVPDNIPDGIYARINFSDGRFIAIRPMYFGARLLIGTTAAASIDVEYDLGTNDNFIELYYNIIFDVLEAGVPIADIPCTRHKPAVADPIWSFAFDELWKQKVLKPYSRNNWIAVPTFLDMHKWTIRPLINIAKREKNGAGNRKTIEENGGNNQAHTA